MNARTTFPSTGRRRGDRFLDYRREHRFHRLIALFERDEIERAVDSLINWLDDHDGDIELEANGDELDGNACEDDFMYHEPDGPGCPVADGGASDRAYAGDPAWLEWHTRGRHKVDRHGAELVARNRHGGTEHEDVEDSDADTSIEDHPLGFDPETDICLAGDDRVTSGAVCQSWHDRTPPGWGIGDELDAEPRYAPASMDAPFAANTV